MIEAHIVKLGGILGQQVYPPQNNPVFSVAESASMALITPQEVDSIETYFINSSMGAWLFILGDQDSGTYTIYSWGFDNGKIKFDIQNYTPEGHTRRSYVWICE
ncbi:hypothetical protein [Dyadobacter aurulentus]|uniref:hypothetical protein n=1 Tax=Dyadobacter sp. UC 10 TaxID=2605428 RepID=UPI0011F172B3|nr:hypothetical protein [Dyadobacter sp. UC 10]KAA0993080.1 hypothetical protein FXO21_24350 [Dyadobacter sp. UC 10]